jgi:hypothetical protein
MSSLNLFNLTIQCHEFNVGIDVFLTLIKLRHQGEEHQEKEHEPTSRGRQGAGLGGGKKPKFIPRGGGAAAAMKAYQLLITEIANYMFNTGKNSFAA